MADGTTKQKGRQAVKAASIYSAISNVPTRAEDDASGSATKIPPGDSDVGSAGPSAYRNPASNRAGRRWPGR